jgi:hypothetical protein
MADNKEASRTTKHIFYQKGEWIFMIFGKRVFDVTEIIQKIK